MMSTASACVTSWRPSPSTERISSPLWNKQKQMKQCQHTAWLNCEQPLSDPTREQKWVYYAAKLITNKLHSLLTTRLGEGMHSNPVQRLLKLLSHLKQPRAKRKIGEPIAIFPFTIPQLGGCSQTITIVTVFHLTITKHSWTVLLKLATNITQHSKLANEYCENDDKVSLEQDCRRTAASTNTLLPWASRHQPRRLLGKFFPLWPPAVFWSLFPLKYLYLWIVKRWSDENESDPKSDRKQQQNYRVTRDLTPWERRIQMKKREVRIFQHR